MRRCLRFIFLVPLLLAGQLCCAADAKPRILKLPHLECDLAAKRVRVECEALDTVAPLEFFVCRTGTNEYESALRSPVTPSDLHTALLAIGLKPGAPVSYSEAAKKMIPPHGPPLHITMEFQKDGKTVLSPANRWLRDVKTKKEARSFTWVFCGSRVMSDGKYAADVTGYIVSVVNFDLTMIDVPELASSANETLEWERNTDIAPKGGTKVWMIIEPAGSKTDSAELAAPGSGTVPAATSPSSEPTSNTPPALTAPAAPPATPETQPSSLSDVHVDQKKVDAITKHWESAVDPYAKQMQAAAQAHYQAIADLRKEQQRLIDEADRIQHAIDDLEKRYQDMVSPHPEN